MGGASKSHDAIVIYCSQCDEVTFFQFLVDPEPYGLTEVMFSCVVSCDVM